MLILTRNATEEIFIIDNDTGEKITIAALGKSGPQMRIGIKAGSKYTILRDEIYYRDNPDEMPSWFSENRRIPEDRKKKEHDNEEIN